MSEEKAFERIGNNFYSKYFRLVKSMKEGVVALVSHMGLIKDLEKESMASVFQSWLAHTEL